MRPFGVTRKPKAQRNLERRQKRQRQPRQAPGHVAIVQAFLNTRGSGAGQGRLATPSDLGTWLSEHSLLPAGTEVTDEDLQRALDIRQGLFTIARSRSGTSLDTAAVRRLDAACRGAHVEVRFDVDGELRFEAASPEPSGALGRLLSMVAEARLLGHWARLKVCANNECQAVYYDLKSRGRWCSHRCGDRIRARQQLRRKK